MKRTFRIGTRPSTLALRQIEEIKGLFPLIDFQVTPIFTCGDLDKVTPISDIEGSDFFTREIDELLLKGKIELAAHSSKDLPDKLTPGLAIVFETLALSPYDVLVSNDDIPFLKLPVQARVGASSNRRKEQVCRLRPDLRLIDIRGNIEERIAFLDRHYVDAVIVAHAALIRLGLENRIAEVFSLDFFPAHPKQGRISLLAKEELCQELKSVLSVQDRATGN